MKPYFLSKIIIPVFLATVLLPDFQLRAQGVFSRQSMQLASNYSGNCGGASVLIMQNGQIVFETYHNGADSSTATHIHSATKFFWAAAAALAMQQGLISSFEEPVVNTIPEWQDTAVHSWKKLIRIKHLLQLSSGLSQDVTQIQGNNPAAANIYQYVIDSLDLQTFPGNNFQYGPSHYYIFGVILQRKLHAANRFINPLQYIERDIFDYIGFEYESWLHDSAGNPHIPNGCYVTARNWVKFGQFMLQNGRWGNTQLVDSNLVKELYVSSGTNPGHGNFCWLNNTDGHGTSANETAPKGSPGGFIYYNGFTEIIGALGAGKNRMYLIPSLNAVALRQTLLENDTFEDHVFLSYLLDSLTTHLNYPQATYPITVFPNPLQNVLTIQSEQIIKSLSICNIFGKLILKNEPLSSNLQIDLEAIDKGIYLIRVTNIYNQTTIKKIAKQ